MARLIRRALGWLIFIGLVAAAHLFARDYIRRHPQDVPWTELSLQDPPGMFTLRKLARLDELPEQCRALLVEAGVRDRPALPRRSAPDCGYADGMVLERDLRFTPSGVITSCPLAAALALFERDVLQPAAERHFGAPVRAVQHAGSYSCRRLYGRAEGPFSEHATADAFDIAGFVLADGTRVSVLGDWNEGGARAAFLREVRDGACGVFATVLSPDYNAAHNDHLHLDMAARGRTGFSVCR